MTDADARSAAKPTRSGWAGAAYFCVVPPAAAAGGMFLAPWMAATALLGAPFRFGRSQALGFAAIAVPLLLFAGWAALSILWSTAEPSRQAARIFLTLLSGLLFVAGALSASDADRRMLRAAGAAAIVVLIGLLLVEALFGMPLNRMDQPDTPTTTLERNPGKGVSVLVALVWGAMGAMIGGSRLQQAVWRTAFVATGFLSLQFGMATNMVAFALGAVAFAAGYVAPRLAPIVAGLGVAGWMLAAPVLTALLLKAAPATLLPLSWQMRLEIWTFAIARIAEKPFTGWGLDAARVFPERLRIGDLEFQAIPLHPHSATLHVWLELGAVGAVLAAAAIAATGFAISRTLARHRAGAAAACGSLVAVASIWNVSYGAFQEWWMVVPFAAAALASAARFPDDALLEPEQ